MNLDTTGKKLLAAVLVAIAAFLLWWSGLLGIGDPTPTPSPTISSSPSPSPSSSPSASPSPAGPLVEVLDSWERPEFAPPSAWATTVLRTIMAGNTDSIVFRAADPCSFAGKPNVNRIVPFTTTKASAPTYPLGTFYDRLEPLTASNCLGAKYLQMDFKPDMLEVNLLVGGNAVVQYTVKGVMPPVPSIPLQIEFNNYTALLGYCGGVYCSAESAGKQGTQVLNDHRMSPYKAWPGGSTSWTDYSLAYQLGLAFLAFGDISNAPQAALTYAATKPSYAYVMDEPKAADEPTLLTRLQGWKAVAPTAYRAVTMGLKHKDLVATSPTYGKLVPWSQAVLDLVDIHVVVAENLCVETWAGSGDLYPCADAYSGKRLWGYVSNMSHGADSGPATGAPDLVIDRPGGEPFGFFLLAVRYGMSGLLYYNSIQGWNAVPGRDVNLDPYQFGGDGDGLILYPDRAKRLALASMRAKGLRQASYWADAVLAAKAKDAAWFTSRILPLMTTPLKFEHNAEVYRTTMMEALSKI